MAQFSSTGTEIDIEIITGEFLFIDPLYLYNIEKDFDTVKNLMTNPGKNLVISIEQTCFPHGGGTLIGYKKISKGLKTFNFDLKSMTVFDDDNEELESQAIKKDITTVGVDSASFLIVDMINFEKIISLISYDELADLDDDNITYIETINQHLGNKGWGYVLSPGMDSGFVFDGDGLYLIR